MKTSDIEVKYEDLLESLTLPTDQRTRLILVRNQAEVIELEHVHFLPGCCVLLPRPWGRVKREELGYSGISIVAHALEYTRENPARSLLVAGHDGDAAGLELSERRAENVYALLIGEAASWAETCLGTGRDTLEVLLRWACECHGLDCDPSDHPSRSGEEEGSLRAALSAFRGAYGRRVGAAMNDEEPQWDRADFEALYDLYEHSLADQLGLEPSGLSALRGGLVSSSPPLLGAANGWRAPGGAGSAHLRSRQLRRVDLVFFEQAPPVPDLYAGETPGALALTNEWRVRRTYVEPFLPAPLLCVRLLGMFFDTNKCFVLPSAVDGIAHIVEVYERFPQGEILIVGHTDASGQPEYNDQLSLERAAAVSAYLRNDVEHWLSYYGSDVDEQKRWGALEDQHMLEALPDAELFLSGPNPIACYQDSRNLDADGLCGPKTRKQLISDYMALDGTTLPEGLRVVEHGCGESFPAFSTRDGEGEASNRRVEMFVFDGVVDPVPASDISGPDSTDYLRWRRAATSYRNFTREPLGTFTSSFAYDETRQLTEDFKTYGFVVWMSRVFGEDVPVRAYRRLYSELSEGSFETPRIVVLKDIEGGHLAAYNRVSQTIELHRDLFAHAFDDDVVHLELMAALLEEFGHHVDHQLRTRLSDVGGDAQLDEGAVFGYGMVDSFFRAKPEIKLGVYSHRGRSVELRIDLSEFNDHVEELLGEWEQRNDERCDHREYFGAGRGKGNGHSFGHESIEDALLASFPDPQERTEIYFGNWLRDHSQALTDKTVRPPGSPAGSPGASAETLTAILDVLARQHFDDKPEFSVTQERLGVYRYEEHIDNPKGLVDGTSVDARLNLAPVPAQSEPNPETWLMKYIDTTVGVHPSAVDYMAGQLRLALSMGRTADGRRHFGQALHVLEDFYAHSNFLELALRAAGYSQVFPFAGERMVRGESIRPLVTGVFGAIDTTASILYVVAEHMTAEAVCTPGIRSPGAEMALILLGDNYPDLAKHAEAALSSYEGLQKAFPGFFRTKCQVFDFVFGTFGRLLGHGLLVTASLIDDAQVEFTENIETSVDPTHTQLAKDHDDHPLHALAAQCAMRAVAVAGRHMAAAWRGQLDADQLVARVSKFFVHPQKRGATAGDPEVQLIFDHISKWGADPSNAKALERIASANIVEHLREAESHAEHRKTARDVVEKSRTLHHSVRPEADDETLDKYYDDMRKFIGEK